MTNEVDSLGRFIRSVNAALVESLTDAHAARLWQRDLNAVEVALVPALKALGGAVYTRDHEPMTDADDTPFLVCRLTPDGRSFAITQANLSAVEGLPDAERFRWDGSPIDE